MGSRKIQPVLALAALWFLVPVLAGAGPAAAAEESIEQLAAAVRVLGLGEGAYVVGGNLTADQVEQALAAPMDDAFAGTIKFADGDLVVVAEEKTYLVLAVFRRREEARADDVAQMVGHLMNRFGEPTTMAHGRLIYWAYGPEGKIAEDTYNEAKAGGRIDILATVKFNSTFEVTPGMDNDNTEETGTIYYIITSDRLLNSFISGP